MSDYYIQLISDTSTLTIDAHSGSFVASTREALDGWYSTPDEKVESTERQSGHGAFAITDDMVLYSARSVTIDLLALGYSRAEVVGLMEQVQRFAGKVFRVRVVDGGRDTYAEGYLATEWDAVRWGNVATAALTIVCPDPRRYATEGTQAFLSPMTGADGGFMFDIDSGVVLSQPFQWAGDTEGGNVAVIENNGTTTAYPTLTVGGYWPNGVIINTDSGQLSYGVRLYYQNLVLDSKSRTASINGVDVTRNLVSRDFPAVEPGETLRLSCNSAGTGGITVSIRDTYI